MWSGPVPFCPTPTVPGGNGSFVDRHASHDQHEYAVRGVIGASTSLPARCEVYLGAEPEPTSPRFSRDDADDNGELDITDGIGILSYLFLGGDAPHAPFPGCGEDPTVDALSCSTQAGCR